VRDYLRHRDDASAASARQQLTALTSAGQPPVQILDRARQPLLTVEGRTPAEGARTAAWPGVDPPSRPGVTAFQASNDEVFWDVLVDVNDAQAGTVAAAEAPRTPLGYVFSRRLLTSTSTADALGRLVGAGAVVQIGNQTGDVWTNLSKVVTAPSVAVGRPGVHQYSSGDGRRHLGASAAVPGTPWIVWVEFPHDLVVAPARVFLTRMVIFGLCFVAVAAVIARIVTGRITTPLHALTTAAEAIAAGQPYEPVAATRRDEIGRLGAAFNIMAAQVQGVQRQLEERVAQRTASLAETGAQLARRVDELHALTAELEAFSYSVSHDLRAPLRHVTGFASLLERSVAGRLSESESRHLRTIVESAAGMGRLIDDLLAFSRMGRAALATGRVSLDGVVRDAQREVNGAEADAVRWIIDDLPDVDGDAGMLRLAFVNLLSNAVKYSAKRPQPEVAVGVHARTAAEAILFVRDNGVGFDMQYAHKLFGVFQRLHSSDEFDGTGIGLANVRRIVQRHGGRVWAEGAVDRGATFFVALPAAAEERS
jgi:signal transduction histidine kinase